jgi:poly-gamma-glutamate capsule biosynthesis protein CapA/YwtB (metallophosphatase superfamily)
LVATGDSLVTRKLSVYDEQEYLSLIKLLRQGDVVFTNLETLIHSYEGYAAAESGGTWMTSPPYVAEELAWAGINLVSRANNHAMDYSVTGMRVTSRYLDEARIAYAGVGESLSAARSPVYIETKGGRVAMISVTSTFPSHAIAGEGRQGIPPRPGLNPLRHTKHFEVDLDTAEKLKLIGSKIGSEIKNLSDKEFTVFGSRFRISSRIGSFEVINKHDLEGNLRSVREARRQADWVLVSLHAHENEGDREVPAGFIEDFARACIDAGADAVIGHGPEVLRGIEIYKHRPIIYSLGCFFLQNETVNRHPADLYEKYDLDWLASAADLHDIREVRGFLDGSLWFSKEPIWWEGMLVQCAFGDGALKEMKLYPVSLGFGESRPRRGRPMLASPEHSRRIVDRMCKLSRRYNTEISFEDDVGFVRL